MSDRPPSGDHAPLPCKVPRLAADPTPAPAVEPEPDRQRYNLSRAKVVPINTNALPSVDVRAILAANVAKEKAAGVGQLQPHRRQFRRWRDYLIALVGGNLVMASALLVFRHNVPVLVCTGSAMTLFTIWITWTLWVVMSDY